MTDTQITTWAKAILAEIDSDAARGLFGGATIASWDALDAVVGSFDYFTAAGVPWGPEVDEDNPHYVTDEVAKAVDIMLKERAEAADAKEMTRAEMVQWLTMRGVAESLVEDMATRYRGHSEEDMDALYEALHGPIA